jgi:hypothetical protein
MNMQRTIASDLGLRPGQVSATIGLLDAENTVPFISRYRKEVTGGLDEEQIRRVDAMLEKLRALDDRRESILKSVEDQGKLTPELRQQFLSATTLTWRFYQPFKPKRHASVCERRPTSGGSDRTGAYLCWSDRRPVLNENVASGGLGRRWRYRRRVISDHPEVRRLAREACRGAARCEKVMVGTRVGVRVVL